MSVQLTKDAPYDVDALRLLRLVYVRRTLRALCLLALIAIPVWAGFSLTVEAITTPGSDAWLRMDDDTGPGFVVILVGLGVAGALLIGTRFLGAAGRTASVLLPVWGRGPEPKLADGAADADALLARIRRKGFARPGAVLTFMLGATVVALAATSAWPAWQANHGRGGPVVTIGKNASVAYSVLHVYHRGLHTSRHRDYFLDTPYGTAIAEDYKPHDGERWVVTKNIVGKNNAYLVGGHDYLLVVLVLLTGLVIAAFAVGWQVVSIRTERRLRSAAGDPDLADDVARLAAGERASLVPAPKRGAVSLGLKPLAGRSAATLLRRRRITSGVLVVLIAGGSLTYLSLLESGVFTPPPTERDVTLGYLVGTGWDPEAYVVYSSQADSLALYRDELDPTDAKQVSAAWSLVLERTATSPNEDTPTASIDVVRIGSADPSRSVAGVVRVAARAAHFDHDAVSSLTGLPPGWRGQFETPAPSTDGHAVWPTATAVSAIRGYLVRISMTGLYIDAKHATASYSPTQLAAWVRPLAAAIGRAGLDTLAGDTVRPEHG